MTPKQRPTAKKILEGIVQAMYDAQEPLDDGLVLVPPLYNVLLHMDAYQDLQSRVVGALLRGTGSGSAENRRT
jgi:hypothetical protein